MVVALSFLALWSNSALQFGLMVNKIRPSSFLLFGLTAPPRMRMTPPVFYLFSHLVSVFDTSLRKIGLKIKNILKVSEDFNSLGHVSNSKIFILILFQTRKTSK